MAAEIRTDWIWGTDLGREYQVLLGGDNRSLLNQEYVRRIDLSLSEEVLWRDLTKGHRSNIKQATKNGIEIKIFDAKTLTPEIWNDFLLAHKTTEARKKRNPRCWQIMFDFTGRGESLLVGARYKEGWIAFACLLVFDNRAYYAMGNVTEESRPLHPSHLIQWEAMRFLKKRGVRYYDIGTDYLGQDHTQKEDNIAKFERGFGGETVKLIK